MRLLFYFCLCVSELSIKNCHWLLISKLVCLISGNVKIGLPTHGVYERKYEKVLPWKYTPEQTCRVRGRQVWSKDAINSCRDITVSVPAITAVLPRCCAVKAQLWFQERCHWSNNQKQQLYEEVGNQIFSSKVNPCPVILACVANKDMWTWLLLLYCLLNLCRHKHFISCLQSKKKQLTMFPMGNWWFLAVQFCIVEFFILFMLFSVCEYIF